MTSTIFSTAIIKREKAGTPITETDLENLAVEAIWKIFDRARLDIALRDGGSEFDLSLKEAKILGFKIDGHKVLNPEGFSGKTVEVSAFVSIGGAEIEEGSLRAYKLMGLSGSVIYLSPGDSKTPVFRASNGTAKKVGEINWGYADIIKSISESFGSDEKTSETIYKRLVNRELSESVLTKLDALLRNSIKGMLASVEAIARPAGAVFVGGLALPDVFYGKKFLFGAKRVTIEKESSVLDLKEIEEGAYAGLNNIVKTRIKWTNNR